MNLDDLVVGDFVWTIITILNLYWIQVPEELKAETPDFVIDDGSLFFQFESPLVLCSLIYNRYPIQELALPKASFEFGFVRHEIENSFTASNFECGLTSHGLYWTDLTNDFDTNIVGFSLIHYHRFSNNGLLTRVYCHAKHLLHSDYS